jgi:DNA replication factor GINS
MAFKDEINYEKISQINKKERKSSKLLTLDSEFYPILITHLRKLQDEYNKKFIESSRSTEALLLNNEICKLDNMIEEIYTRRERKILLSTMDINQNPDLKNMLKHEQELYYKISKILNEYREGILSQSPNPECADIEQSKSSSTPPPPSELDKVQLEPEGEHAIEQEIDPESVDQELQPLESEEDHAPEPEKTDNIVPDTASDGLEETSTEVPEESPEQDSDGVNAADTANDDQLLVYVLEDLEPFVGTDSSTYKLCKEDLVTVPKLNAEILIKNNKARLVEPEI